MTAGTGRTDGKVVIVTGGASGLGAAYCLALAAEGAHVVVADRDEQGAARTAEQGGHRCTPARLDVVDEDDWTRVVASTVETHGRLDGLVNNAGIVIHSALVDTTVEQFRAVTEVNILGTFLGIRSVAADMRDSGGGSIVNVSSTAGLTGVPGIPGYTASKWAVRGMARSAATELAPWGIRVNVVAPGTVLTPMVQRSGRPPRNLQERYADVSELTPMVVFLMSDESAFCTGTDFVADGGETASSRLPAPGAPPPSLGG